MGAEGAVGGAERWKHMRSMKMLFGARATDLEHGVRALP